MNDLVKTYEALSFGLRIPHRYDTVITPTSVFADHDETASLTQP